MQVPTSKKTKNISKGVAWNYFMISKTFGFIMPEKLSCIAVMTCESETKKYSAQGRGFFENHRYNC